MPPQDFGQPRTTHRYGRTRSAIWYSSRMPWKRVTYPPVHLSVEKLVLGVDSINCVFRRKAASGFRTLSEKYLKDVDIRFLENIEKKEKIDALFGCRYFWKYMCKYRRVVLKFSVVRFRSLCAGSSAHQRMDRPGR